MLFPTESSSIHHSLIIRTNSADAHGESDGARIVWRSWAEVPREAPADVRHSAVIDCSPLPFSESLSHQWSKENWFNFRSALAYPHSESHAP